MIAMGFKPVATFLLHSQLCHCLPRNKDNDTISG
jgi:hypothetical protein